MSEDSARVTEDWARVTEGWATACEDRGSASEDWTPVSEHFHSVTEHFPSRSVHFPLVREPFHPLSEPLPTNKVLKSLMSIHFSMGRVVIRALKRGSAKTLALKGSSRPFAVLRAGSSGRA